MNVQEFYKKLDETFRKGDSQNVTDFLEQSLAEAKEQEDALGIIAVSNELGGVYRVTGKTQAAKEICEDVLKRIEAIGMGDTQHYATALLNAGDVHLSAGEWEAAIDLFVQAKERLAALELDKDYRMAALCNNMSVAYRQMGKLQEAEAVLDIALSVIGSMPEYIAELATTHVNLGQLQVKQDKMDAAKESFQEAIRIFEEHEKGQDPHYATALAGLGEIFFAAGELDSAEAQYHTALSVIAQNDGQQSPDYEAISQKLENIREEKKKHQEHEGKKA